MRLIDISKLQKIEMEHERYDYCRGCMDGYNTCIEDLETVPEVKAIPIEWIEKKCRELYEHLYLDESLGVQMLLRDWEKENEKEERTNS